MRLKGALEADKRGSQTTVYTGETRPAAPVLPTGTWSEKMDLLVKCVAGSDVPVLLRGETGVGKEVLARKLHEHSKRAGRCFLKLNCAALPSELVESELFGYENSRTEERSSWTKSATWILNCKPSCSRSCRTRNSSGLGPKDTQHVDVRVMAATHCDLQKSMLEGRFREDLYYRLNIIEVHVPPLRKRKDEVLTLTRFFVDKYAPEESNEISPALAQALLDHDWPDKCAGAGKRGSQVPGVP